MEVRVCRHKGDLQGKRISSLQLTRAGASCPHTPWQLVPELLKPCMHSVGEKKDLERPLFDVRAPVRGSAPVGRQISRLLFAPCSLFTRQSPENLLCCKNHLGHWEAAVRNRDAWPGALASPSFPRGLCNWCVSGSQSLTCTSQGTAVAGRQRHRWLWACPQTSIHELSRSSSLASGMATGGGKVSQEGRSPVRQEEPCLSLGSWRQVSLFITRPLLWLLGAIHPSRASLNSCG